MIGRAPSDELTGRIIAAVIEVHRHLGSGVVEVKATDGTSRVHHAQLLTYLKVSDKPRGLLINFNVPVLKDGVKRIVNRYTSPDSRRLSVSASDYRRPA